jgi:DNA polymerase-3 subunit beta
VSNPRQIVVERNALHAALGQLKAAVPRRNTIPILANIRLFVAGDLLQLVATDLEVEMRTAIPLKGGTDLDTTIPAERLAGIVAKLPDRAEITIAATDSEVTIRSGRGRYTLMNLPSTDFPELASGDFPTRFTIGGKALAAMLAGTDFAICDEASRYYLCGIYLHVAADGRLTAVATNGHILARYAIDAPAGSAGMKPVIVPEKTVAMIGRLAAEAGELAVETSESKIRVAAGEAVLTSKLIDGTYPDYVRVIPRDYDRHATFERMRLAEAAARVTAVSGERVRALAVAFDGNRLTLSVNDQGVGGGEEEVDATVDSDPITIGFNGRYLAEVLDRLPGNSVEARFDNPGGPALLFPAGETVDGASHLVVLMPLRV